MTPLNLCAGLTPQALGLLMVAFLAWVPYAIWERPMPRMLRYVVLVLTVAGITIAVLILPWVCGPCRGGA